ncbi:hypothetical protein C8R46DRAFT_1303338 [Mycena filopes]|nr:hypothetical protein C8R46DRAFT_1303338 [Mycena filopes]
MSLPSHSPIVADIATQISTPIPISTSTSPPRAPPTPPPDSAPPSPRIAAAIPTATTASSASSSPSQSSTLTAVAAAAPPTTTTSLPSPQHHHATFASVVVSSPPSPILSLLPTSVSSPAWFPPFDADAETPASPDSLFSPLVPSSSSATLVDAACFSPPSKSTLGLSPVAASAKLFDVHEITHDETETELEEGEIVSDSDAHVLMKDLRLQDAVAAPPDPDSNSNDSQLEPGQIIVDSPVLPSVLASQDHQQEQQTQTQTPPRTSPSPPCAPARPTIPLPPIDAVSPHPFPAPSPASVPAPASPDGAPPDPAPKPVEDQSQSQSQSAPTDPAEQQQPPPKPDPTHTPNVYINGLPPNFPEDQLFELAAPFGAVRSVRSFTRHVGDAETGYGFVLFETIASAEKCINSLRRFRNLHPTFSKQVHKIPGTMYSQPRPAAALALAPTPTSAQSASNANNANNANNNANNTNGAHSAGTASSLAAWEQESAATSAGEDAGFKAKMERLADRASTNLYIEGLPLSIDEATLAALVSPYSIRSSRFFQTKLSSPPRIIAFVRLETRGAAEEIIERLHGRMVRGWNDPGSRISVRFADTSEQRELRERFLSSVRQERLAREGDQTTASSQLSIAQATLLNLRGKELHARPLTHLMAVAAEEEEHGAFGFGDEQLSEYSSGGHFHNDAYPTSDFEVDYSRVPAAARYSLGAGQQQFSHHHQHLPTHAPPPQQQRMNPAMASLLDSLQASSAGFRGRDVDPYAPHHDELGYRSALQHHHQQQQQHLASLPLSNTHTFGGNARPFVAQGLGIGIGMAHTSAQAQHGGYTATEEFILRARANSLPQGAGAKRRPVALELGHHELEAGAGGANIAMGVRGYRAQASTLSFPHHHRQQQQQQQQQHRASAMFDAQDSMNEEEFHAASSVPHQMHVHRPQQQQQQQFENGGERIMNQLSAHSHTNNGRVPRNQSLQQQQHLSASLRAPNQTQNQHQNQHHDFIPHARTQQPLAANQQTHHYQQHPTAHSRTMTNNIRPAQASNNNMMNTNNSSLGNSNGIYERDRERTSSAPRGLHHPRHNGGANNNSNGNGYSGSHSHSHSNLYSSHQHGQHQHQHHLDDHDQASPPLVSPALTYSSRSSVAAFSPATPFFGSFDEDETTFRAPQMDAKGLKKSNSRTATR